MHSPLATQLVAGNITLNLPMMILKSWSFGERAVFFSLLLLPGLLSPSEVVPVKAPSNRTILSFPRLEAI